MFLYRYASTYVVLFSFLVPPTSQTYPFGSLPSCWGVILFFVFVFLAGFSLFARFFGDLSICEALRANLVDTRLPAYLHLTCFTRLLFFPLENDRVFY